MIRMGNQRRRRTQYVLEVAAPTEGRTRRRLRWLAGLLVLLAVVGLTSFGTWRGLRWGMARLVYENPRFAIRDVIVENDGALTPQQIQSIAGVAVGQNLLALDLAEVQRRLEAVAMVRRVEVRRLMPARLLIRLNERLAVARLRPNGMTEGYFYLDRGGTLMSALRLGDGTRVSPQSAGPLPLLTGVTLAEWTVGRPVQSEAVHRALELLDRMQQAAAGSMLEVEAVDLSRPQLLRVQTRQGMVVKFDASDFGQQLRRLSVILTWAMQRQKLVAAVDLTVPRGVPVQLVN